MKNLAITILMTVISLTAMSEASLETPDTTIYLTNNSLPGSLEIKYMNISDQTLWLDGSYEHKGQCTPLSDNLDQPNHISSPWVMNTMTYNYDMSNLQDCIVRVNIYITDQSDNEDYSTITFIIGNASVSIQEQDPIISVYPNPTIDNINISEPYDELTIYNTQGQELIRAQNEKTIDLTFLPIGHYIIRIKKQEQINTLQIRKE